VPRPASSAEPSRSSGSAQVTIAADPATVYKLVSDVTGYGRFSPENRSAAWRRNSPGPVVGARFSSWNRRGWFWWRTSCVVEAAEPGKEFGFRVVFPPPMPATRWRYRIEPVGDHESRVTESWQLPRPLGIGRRTMMRLFLGVRDRPASLTSGAEETLHGMRRWCEGNAADQSSAANLCIGPFGANVRLCRCPRGGAGGVVCTLRG
jgi:hypothetical protein